MGSDTDSVSLLTQLEGGRDKGGAGASHTKHGCAQRPRLERGPLTTKSTHAVGQGIKLPTARISYAQPKLQYLDIKIRCEGMLHSGPKRLEHAAQLRLGARPLLVVGRDDKQVGQVALRRAMQCAMRVDQCCFCNQCTPCI